MLVPIHMGTNMAAGKETSVTEFCYKSVNYPSRNSKTLK